ncbi:hypothetical protein [Ruminococcus bromii]|jgi:hypothetical protein|nr:hypothetical protein [Ruminococcus bromii]
MYKKIIETTILNLSIGTTAPAESSCKTLYQQSLEQPVAAQERQI